MSIQDEHLIDYVVKQLNTFFPDSQPVDRKELLESIKEILERIEFCFSHINNKYFFNGDDVIFNHLHGDQYAMFLYYSSNTIYINGGNETLCTKLFYLNRLLHGIDVFYEVSLPEIFLFVHPLGTILGRGTYSDYFLVYQRCGIGSNKELYPTMKRFVTLRPGSSILGNCLIGENCTLGANSLLIDQNLENNTVFIGNPKSYFKRKKKEIDPIWRI
jgi:serine O-acetyltransferase